MARRGLAKMLRYFSDFVEAAKLPAEQQRARVDEIGPEFVKRASAGAPEDVMLALLMPALEKLCLATLRNQAQLRTAILALAAERFRRDSGDWPTSLTELVPRYISQIQNDPFDGQMLRVRSVPAGIVIYSVGYDAKDDGGKLDSRKVTEPGYDIGIRLWDAIARRQQAELLAAPRPDPKDSNGP
jgi:hypothetical protein